MQKTNRSCILLLGTLAILSLSCSKFHKLGKSSDWRKKYQGAVSYYENGDYYRAATLLEQIRLIVRGMPEGANVEFMLAYCQYYEKSYLLAAYQFKVFYETYSRSNLTEEATFMQAYSLYAFSPTYTLDQSEAIDAMRMMQAFINKYPDSQFMEQAIQVIEDCQRKLEEKNYKNAKLYLNLRMYKAAVIAFESFEQRFPDSQYLEDITFFKLQSQFKLANRSFEHVQQERHKIAIDFYYALLDTYPESKYLREAEKYYIRSKNKIEQQKTNL